MIKRSLDGAKCKHIISKLYVYPNRELQPFENINVYIILISVLELLQPLMIFEKLELKGGLQAYKNTGREREREAMQQEKEKNISIIDELWHISLV